MRNLCAYLTGPQRIDIRSTKMPAYGPDDVLIAVRHVGICGSDVHFFEDPTYGGTIPNPPTPLILGHECAGKVVATGENVTRVKTGDFVAVEPGIPCGKCSACLSGHYNLCENMVFMAWPPFSTAAFCKYIAYPAFMTFKLPGERDTLAGAMMEPLAVGMYAVRKSGITLGDCAVIQGSGCIGLMTLLSCLAAGISRVIMVDLYDNRLAKAKALGAAMTVNGATDDVRAAVLTFTEGHGADFVFETAGAAEATERAPYLARKGGKIIMVGNVLKKPRLDLLYMNNHEIDLFSVNRYHGIYPIAMDLYNAGRLDPSRVVTRVLPFEQIQQAFEIALNNKATVIKLAVAL